MGRLLCWLLLLAVGAVSSGRNDHLMNPNDIATGTVMCCHLCHGWEGRCGCMRMKGLPMAQSLSLSSSLGSRWCAT